MKKIIALMMIMILAFVGCSKKADQTKVDKEVTVESLVQKIEEKIGEGKSYSLKMSSKVGDSSKKESLEFMEGKSYFDNKNKRFKFDGTAMGQKILIIFDQASENAVFVSNDGGKNFQKINDQSFNAEQMFGGTNKFFEKEILEDLKKNAKIEQKDGKIYLVLTGSTSKALVNLDEIKFIFSQDQEFEGIVLEGSQGSQKVNFEMLDIQELKEEIELPKE